MIEISHKQAQRLLHRHLDERLPNELWMNLQTHLETCPDCRADYDVLVGLEKNLKRSLHAVWEGTHGPTADIDREIILAFARRRQRRRKSLLIAGAAVLLIFFLVLLGGPAGIRARFGAASGGPLAASSVTPPGQATVVQTAVAAMQPTVEPGQFSDVIAYQSRRNGLPNGDGEIYLLNPGSASVDLTNNPAQDTDPAWSPDGEWLAFLSDRTGKIEVFVTNITASRVVQLTDEPGITWHGPLSWSPDGKWITLNGSREQQGSQDWIYLVALDGTGVRSLAGSRGGDSPKYSPAGNQIAYHFSDGNDEGVIVQDLKTGDQRITKWVDNPLVPSPAPGSAFDWSPDGMDLVYVSANPNPVASADRPGGDAPLPSGEPGSQVFVAREINRPSTQAQGQAGSLQIDSSRWPSAFRGVTWSLDGAVVYLEDLGDARAVIKPSTQPEGCLTVQLSYASQGNRNNAGSNLPESFGGLCVEGGLDQASWTADGRWIVVQGRLPSESRLSIYALRMPTGPGRNRGAPNRNRGSAGSTSELPSAATPGTILRLSDDMWPGPLPSPRPRPNSSAVRNGIDPKPVHKTSLVPPPANMTGSRLAGRIGYTVQNHNMNMVASANPDGTGGELLLATLYQIRCPTWSPDGKEIALIQGTAASLPPQSSTAKNLHLNQQALGQNPNDANTAASEAAGAASEAAASAAASAEAASVENIYVLDNSSRLLRQVSGLDSLPVIEYDSYQVNYGCPVWSPEGASGDQYLAALVRDRGNTYLAVLPAGTPRPFGDLSTAKPRYLPVDSPDWSQPLVWSLDGKSIFLMHSTASVTEPAITVVDVPDDPQAPLTIQTSSPSVLLQAVSEVAILPSGTAMVELEVNSPAGSAHLHRITFSAAGGSSEVGPPVYLTRGQQTGASQATTIVSGSLTWLYGSTFGVILHAGPQDALKTLFFLYSLSDDKVQAVASFEDTVNSAAWSPDGRWLIYSAESGLWGVDISAAARGLASPTWLSPQSVQDLVWK